MHRFVRISKRDSRYLELDDGSPFAPIGCNLCWSGRDDAAQARGKQLLDRLAEHAGNFARLWISSPGFDIESAAGQFSASAVDRLRGVVDHARARGIRLKMTLEYFRFLLPAMQIDHLLPSGLFAREIYHHSRGGPLESMQQYLDSQVGRDLFLRKLDLYATHFADDPAIFGWELWNEMNCVHATRWDAWTGKMLDELRARFPRHLVMQSLGSLDSPQQTADYHALSAVEGQDIAQVHRYLDEGAAQEICHGPLDVSLSQAMTFLRDRYPGKPLLLAETGAVQPKHEGPWRHYAQDTDGMILEDVVFGGFFTGGCGCGQCWHWDCYIDDNNLWWMFARFAQCLRGIDAAAEHFKPFVVSTTPEQLRVYGLQGCSTVMLWVRDARDDWRSRFEAHRPPQQLVGQSFNSPTLADYTAAQCYSPCTDTWIDASITNSQIELPPFTRSMVVIAR